MENRWSNNSKRLAKKWCYWITRILNTISRGTRFCRSKIERIDSIGRENRHCWKDRSRWINLSVCVWNLCKLILFPDLLVGRSFIDNHHKTGKIVLTIESKYSKKNFDFPWPADHNGTKADQQIPYLQHQYIIAIHSHSPCMLLDKFGNSAYVLKCIVVLAQMANLRRGRGWWRRVFIEPV